jgi:dienelactone hydrolase
MRIRRSLGLALIGTACNFCFGYGFTCCWWTTKESAPNPRPGDMSLPATSASMEWSKLDFQTFASHDSSGPPQIFKDVAYRDAVYKAWQEESEREYWSLRTDVWAETSSVVYESSSSSPTSATSKTATKVPLYGHVVRRKVLTAPQQQPETLSHSLPGVLLFHTGAGPHDIFLLWKAESLVRNTAIFPNGCVVLVADVLSDETGWAWNPDRSRYNQVRDTLFAIEETDVFEPQRPELQRRVAAAYSLLCSFPEVDSSRIASLGWCLGGHAIFDLGMHQHDRFPGLRAMVTFHGVFGSMQTYLAAKRRSDDHMKHTEIGAQPNSTSLSFPCHVLICNGSKDPFVDPSDLLACAELLQGCGHKVRVLQLQEATHGFTNPAQELNDNPAFDCHVPSATVAWHDALELLKTCFWPPVKVSPSQET